MSHHSFIASGGIGNRSAAISSVIYANYVLNIDVTLVWDKTHMENTLPEQIWENWNFPYVTSNTNDIFCLNWFTHANASKSETVRKWWKSLIPIKKIRDELDNLKKFYDCSVVLRDNRQFKTKMNLDLLKHYTENFNDILVVGDTDSSINNVCKLLGNKSHKVENSNHFTDDLSIKTHENVITSIIEWYGIQRSGLILRNTPVSSFCDYAEFMLDIKTIII